MTHIIGKPQPPKWGATFGDVPVGGACIRKGNVATVRLVRMDEHKDADGRRWNAVALGGTTLMWVDYQAPVTPLRIEPVEPEPDPGVPYGEQQPGDWFVFPSEPKVLCQCTLHGHTSQGAHHDAARFGHLRVTPVPASVVVHEEPEFYVGHVGGIPTACLGFTDDDGEEREHVVSAREAGRLVAQLSAWLYSLAQRDAEREEDERANRVVDAAMSRARLTQTTTPLESAEDRSKPAPGYWVVCIDLGSDKHWIANGKGWSDYWYLEESQAIAATWERHAQRDAEREEADAHLDLVVAVAKSLPPDPEGDRMVEVAMKRARVTQTETPLDPTEDRSAERPVQTRVTRRDFRQPHTPAVTADSATVYKGGGRRYFTRRAAYRAAAKARAFELRPCDCSPAEYDTGYPGDVCELHGMDRDHFCRIVHRLAAILQAQDRKHGGGS